jgi:hypothetical protein
MKEEVETFVPLHGMEPYMGRDGSRGHYYDVVLRGNAQCNG